jgi:hypothetical protein
MESTPVISTDTSGNRVETIEFKDTSGNTIIKKYTFVKTSLASLLSNGRMYILLFVLFSISAVIGFIFYWISSKFGKTGYILYGSLSILSILSAILMIYFQNTNQYRTYTIGETTTKSPDGKILSITGFYSGNDVVEKIDILDLSFLASIFSNIIYAYLSFKNAFSSAPTNVATTQAGGKRKKTHRR